MKLTQRDIEILKFINEFGFCEIKHIEKKFDLKKPRSYQVMNRLTNENLVFHKRIFHGRNGIFYLSRKGAVYTDLPAIVNIPIAIYEHQLAIIEIHFKLLEQYPEAEWFSERRLNREKSANGIGQRGHISDGLLILPDNKKFAIEVELTMKGKLRLQGILRAYGGSLKVEEAWYFCSPSVLPKMREIAGQKSFIKIFSLS